MITRAVPVIAAALLVISCVSVPWYQQLADDAVADRRLSNRTCERHEVARDRLSHAGTSWSPLPDQRLVDNQMGAHARQAQICWAIIRTGATGDVIDRFMEADAQIWREGQRHMPR